MEREQIDSWRNTRPGERILDIGKNQLNCVYLKSEKKTSSLGDKYALFRNDTFFAET